MAQLEVVRIRRVVVGFADAAAAAGDLIATAAELARVLHVELWGLFVEDALLFDAAALTLLRAIEPRQLVWRSLTATQLAQAHAVAAGALERHLLDAAAALGVPAGFQVVRGDPATMLLRQCEPSDLLVIAEPADPIARAMHPYPRLVRALCETASAVLFIPHGARRRKGPVVAFARSPDDPSLALAASIAAASGERLIVLASGGPESEQKIADDVRALASGGVTLRLAVRDAQSWREAVHAALGAYREQLLLVSRPAVEADFARYLRLAGERAVPVLVAAS
jgi:hypothetical protein